MSGADKAGGRLIWQTPLARELLLRYYGMSAPQTPEAVLNWLRRHLADSAPQVEPPRLTIEQGPHRRRRHGDEPDQEASSAV